MRKVKNAEGLEDVEESAEVLAGEADLKGEERAVIDALAMAIAAGIVKEEKADFQEEAKAEESKKAENEEGLADAEDLSGREAVEDSQEDEVIEELQEEAEAEEEVLEKGVRQLTNHSISLIVFFCINSWRSLAAPSIFFMK